MSLTNDYADPRLITSSNGHHRGLPQAPTQNPHQPSEQTREPTKDNWDTNEKEVLSLFPDICSDYLQQVAAEHQWDPQRTITHILDQQDDNLPYPTKKQSLKRKRQESEQEESRKTQKTLPPVQERLAGKDSAYVSSYTKAS